jgi:hypothetical protein
MQRHLNMNSQREIIASKSIAPCISVVRGQRVILDSDLASLYGVPTKRLNQQLARNRRKFLADFAFQLTAEEWEKLRLDKSGFKTREKLEVAICNFKLEPWGPSKTAVCFH